MLSSRISIYIIAFVIVLGVVFMPRTQYIGDPLAVRLEAWSILQNGSIEIPANFAEEAGEPGQYFVKNIRNGRYYCKYGILNAVASLPALIAERLLCGELVPFRDNPRTLILNIWNIILSAVLAALLVKLASLFSDKALPVCLWTGATLYCSFGWNYLRAQTSEILQWTLATWLFLELVKLYREKSQSSLVKAHFSFMLLILTKSVYALFAPVILAVSWKAGGKKFTLYTLAALFGEALCVLWLNFYKFGSPWLSGYTQWTREEHFFSGNMLEGLWGFLFNAQKSIFIYEPLLIAALFGLGCFYKRFKAETLVFYASLLIFMVFNAQTINWGGHWSYGPRYLLAVLAPATLPALCLLDNVLSAGWSVKHKLSAVLAGIILVFSLFLQMQVNSLEFFTYYHAEAVLERSGAAKGCAALQKCPFGIVNIGLKRIAKDKSWPFWMNIAADEIGAEKAAADSAALTKLARSNYYFWD